MAVEEYELWRQKFVVDDIDLTVESSGDLQSLIASYAETVQQSASNVSTAKTNIQCIPSEDQPTNAVKYPRSDILKQFNYFVAHMQSSRIPNMLYGMMQLVVDPRKDGLTT